ncbi:MAG: hypothetical protein IT325_11470 [Anaerolineae bacterium]|nr:hypothetical protein [Anaerolineae bacterium]
MFRRYVDAILKWFWLPVLTTVVAGAIAYAYAQRQPVTYSSRVQLLVGPATTSLNPTPNDLRAAAQLLEVYAVLPTMRPFLEDVITELELDLTPGQLDNMITISTSSTTQLLTIRVVDSERPRASVIANTVAGMIVARSAGGSSGDAVQQIQQQIDRVEASVERSEARLVELQQQRDTATTDSQRSNADKLIESERKFLSDSERLLVSLYGEAQTTPNNRVQIVDPATRASRVNRETSTKATLGGLAGLIIGIALVLALDFLDDTFKSEESLVQAAGVPVLGVIARHRALHFTGAKRLIVTTQPASRAAQNYRKLGAKLVFLNSNQGYRSLLVGSPRGTERPAEVAANVAAVLGQLGRTVILVDADLRTSTISKMFGMEKRHGLTDLFSEERSLTECVAPVDDVENLFVLPSGLSVNAGGLLASDSMMDLIEHLQSLADLIIIVAPPFQEQAEGIVLASRANGTIVTAMYGQTRRREIREIMEDLYSLGARVIGTVLTFNTPRSRRFRRGRQRATPVETVSVAQLSKSERARKGAG